AVLVAACRAACARRGASPVDARSAELLVRRGVHARPRPARQPFGDAALGRPQRELPAALVPARVARRACVRRRRDRAAPPVRATRRAALPAVGVIAVVGAGLLPLLIAQGGHHTQWIGRWALTSRLQAIPQYFLTGYSGAPLGHSVEVLIAAPVLALLALGILCLPPPATARARARSRASPSAPPFPRNA